VTFIQLGTAVPGWMVSLLTEGGTTECALYSARAMNPNVPFVVVEIRSGFGRSEAEAVRSLASHMLNSSHSTESERAAIQALFDAAPEAP
jgi:hypothetical protein